MPSSTDHGPFVAIANEPGRHGFEIVGPFDTAEEADAWLVKKKLSTSISAKALIAPADWERQSAKYDDTPKEFES